MNGTYLLAKKADAPRLVLNTDLSGYIGRSIAPVTKVVQGPTNFNVTLPVGVPGKNNRKHGTRLITTAVNYTGGVAMATTKLTGAGNNALTVTITPDAKRQPSGVVVVAGGAGYAIGDTFQLNADATGAGAVFTVATINAGAVLTATYNAASATATPCPPDFVITSLAVNIGANITQENVDPIFYAMRRQMLGLVSPLGELSIDWTDPARNFLRNNENTAWDTMNFGTLTITGNINPNAVNPTIVAEEEYDTLRNSFVDNKTGNVYGFNRPYKRQQQNGVLIVGQANLNTLKPKGNIARIMVRNLTTPGTITAAELWSDGQLRVKGNLVDIYKVYRPYGFHFPGDPSYVPNTIGSSNQLQGALNPVNFFDAAIIFDYDGREGQALPILNPDSLELKLTSTVAQNCTVYMETQPGGFA